MSKLAKPYKQFMDPEVAASGGWHSAKQMGLQQFPPGSEEWESMDISVAIATDGYGTGYVVDRIGTIYVEFDLEDHDQIHAACRWISVYLSPKDPADR